MRPFKKIAASLIALSVAVSAFSLSVSADEEEVIVPDTVTETIPNTGGWTFCSAGAYNLTDEEKGILDEAMTQFDVGGSYEGVATMATFTETGTDYAFLCIVAPEEQDAEPEWVVISAYADLEGYVTFNNIIRVLPGDLDVMEQPKEKSEESWKVETGREPAGTFPAAVTAAFSEHTGVSLEPMAVLSTQVVAGTNYRCLAYGTLVTAEPVSYIYAVDVYEDAEGNASITDIDVLDLFRYAAKDKEDSEDEPVAGGWEFSAECVPNIGPVVQTVFNEAVEGLSGSNITPVDVISIQKDEGTNLAYLCIVEPVVPDAVPHWAVATIFVGRDYSVELRGFKDIDPADVAILEEIPESGLPGGWHSTVDDIERDLSGGLAEALSDLVGVVYSPIAVLGTQTVAGTNYRILAYGTLVTADPVTNLYVIDVYEDLDGETEVTAVDAFDLLAYISEPQAEPEDSSEDESEEESEAPESQDESEAPESQDESKAPESKSDSKTDTNPKTGAFAMGIGAAAIAAAAVAVTRKKKNKTQ